MNGADGSKLRKAVTEGSSNKNTDYLNGFQYTNEILEFFPTTEGYVRAVPTSIGGGPSTYSFHYIFNYTDHTSTPLSTGLGNIRLKYTAHPQTGEPQSLEENHYYPFACPLQSIRGLTHDGYQPHHDIIGLEGANVTIIPTSTNVNDPYKYKYQGQEFQDELGLNWYSFKWRNYMSDIGRFFNPDPLSEKYAYQSHYNFSENRVIDGRELEGLEWENFRTTGKNPGSLKMKLPSSDAQRQHYSVAVTNSDVSFSNLKSSFKESPQKFLTNSKATFNSPVDGEGNSSNFETGSYIKIDIKGPMNNAYVKVVGMEDKDDYMSATFATMEGHVEKGKITFRLYDEGNGDIKFTINSMSEVDMGLAPEKYSREQQTKSWNEVLSNISKYLGEEETKRESRVVEPKKEEDK